MGKIAETAGDIVAASSAIAGLILVYIGAISSSFASFQAQERRTVVGSHQRRAWFAFVGLVLLLLSVSLALCGKWLDVQCLTLAALVLLFVGLLWVIATAVLSVMEIR